MTYIRLIVTLLALPLILSLAGCGSEPKLPELTEVEGQVLINGQPLPSAKVTFNPTMNGLPANSSGMGITDEMGKFKLSTAGQLGAVPGEHVVTVAEGPPPENVRGDEGQAKMANYQASLKNRPIPARYGAVNQSEARITVTTDKKEYKIELNR
jgi:hypothetical protein